jgi:hypothetical protein
MTELIRYSLQDFNNIIFDGFNFKLPEETNKLISSLTIEVGSPSYIKTPIFQKKDHSNSKTNSNNSSVLSTGSFNKKKKNGNKSVEVTDDDWETLRTFHATKIEQKVGLDGQIDIIRSHLNKMSDKNYNELKDKIIEIIDQLILNNITNEDLLNVSSSIFDIASANRFYSKLYADLYSELIKKYSIMQDVFENSLLTFVEVFNTIEYVDPDVDYNQFCKINKINERRKALSAFFVNLSNNNIISIDRVIQVICDMLKQVNTFILQENKKNEVDELTENISILCTKKILENTNDSNIDGLTIIQTIEKLSKSKVKTYPSLSNKSIFKYMDLIEM